MTAAVPGMKLTSPALLSYAEEHGLTPAGPILELLLADIHQTDDVQECRTELQILCETC